MQVHIVPDLTITLCRAGSLCVVPMQVLKRGQADYYIIAMQLYIHAQCTCATHVCARVGKGLCRPCVSFSWHRLHVLNMCKGVLMHQNNRSLRIYRTDIWLAVDEVI